MKDLNQQGQVDNQFYKSMDPLLALADQLQHSGHERVSILLLQVFSQTAGAPHNQHVTPAAAQQLIDLTQKIIDTLR